MKKLPLFELRINPDQPTGVEAIALVDEPAIEQDYMFFSAIKENFQANDEKQELLGPAMIPDKRIYRRDKSGFEYEVYFTPETVREIAQQYMKNGFQNSLNLNHSSTPAKSYVFQSYIVDSSKGINAPKGIECGDGSWIVGVKVEDKDVWADVKAGKMKGFSIEGLFNQVEVKDAELNQIFSLINDINNIIDKMKK